MFYEIVYTTSEEGGFVTHKEWVRGRKESLLRFKEIVDNENPRGITIRKEGTEKVIKSEGVIYD